MKKLWLVFLVVLGLAGCREAASPDLRIEKNTLDSMHQVNSDSQKQTTETNPQVVKNLGSNTKIVTGVPATVEDKNDVAAQDPKDKPGAVAVKMEY